MVESLDVLGTEQNRTIFTYFESYGVQVCVRRSARRPSSLENCPLVLGFTLANTDPSSGVFCVSNVLVEIKWPCLEKNMIDIIENENIYRVITLETFEVLLN